MTSVYATYETTVTHLLLFAHDHNVHLILYADQSDECSEQSLSFGNMCMYNHFEVSCSVFTIMPLRLRCSNKNNAA